MKIVMVKDEVLKSLSKRIFYSSIFSLLMSFSQKTDQRNTVSTPWRSELSKTDIWYACFGSNMSKSRFRCYIEGGQVKVAMPHALNCLEYNSNDSLKLLS